MHLDVQALTRQKWTLFRKWTLLIDEFRSARDGRSGHGQSGGSAAAAIRRLRVESAITVDQDVFGDHHEALGAIGRFVDDAADRDACIGHVDATGKIPRWIISGVGEVDVVCQIGILIDCNSRERSTRRRLGIENACRAA